VHHLHHLHLEINTTRSRRRNEQEPSLLSSVLVEHEFLLGPCLHRSGRELLLWVLLMLMLLMLLMRVL